MPLLRSGVAYGMALYQGRKEGEMPQCYLSLPERVDVVVVGRIPGPRIKGVHNWELLRRMEFRQHHERGQRERGDAAE